ncbi:phosphoribosyltransferase family protein [Bacteroidetes bacterium endosymbiont of Geopemphigus sp.]|uniref:phosphoribosyltransferase family protein n=1 Tax=Bacteroidetes bacterium endosymbiont of Geopemphigus sp. TaxID=2047937 RepID=UPI000CD15C71|nr:phosphoribosyltransferase family protein [Bacteroidetes bacterium endosymbiont of Geopemphigus sp.]
MADANLHKDIVEEFYNCSQGEVDSVCGIESRGFLFGSFVAQRLNVPFMMIRKQGKLPGDVLSQT